MIEYVKWPHIHVINLSNGIVKLEENFHLCLTFIENTISYLLLNFSCVSQELDNSCSSNKFEANFGIQNKTAKRSIIIRFLSVH